MSDYFFSEKMRRKIIEKTEDGKGVKLGFGEINAYRNLENYTNWLMSVNYSTLKDEACAKGVNPFARLID